MNEQELKKIHQKYGEAFILISRIEFLLEAFLRTKCGFNQLNEDIASKILDNATLGRKFELSKKSLDNELLKKKIETLIPKRNQLAHSFLTPFKHDDESFLALISKLTVTKIDEVFFDELIQLGNEIIDLLDK
jgi:hypothetical protein